MGQSYPEKLYYLEWVTVEIQGNTRKAEGGRGKRKDEADATGTGRMLLAYEYSVPQSSNLKSSWKRIEGAELELIPVSNTYRLVPLYKHPAFGKVQRRTRHTFT
jgi:hypothetical protein